MNHPYLPWIAAGIFALAVLHTFSTKYFEHLAHTHPRHAGIWHLLGEVEVVFGLWAMVLALTLFAFAGKAPTLEYLESRNFTEPLFVFAIMVVAGTRPILQVCGLLVQQVARLAPLPTAMVNYFLLLSVVPLLGSLITEPAAMTLAALMLRDSVFSARVSEKLKYATLGDWWDAYALCRTARADGGGHLAVGPALHAPGLRLEGGRGRLCQCRPGHAARAS
jgi:hypothetical protein